MSNRTVSTLIHLPFYNIIGGPLEAAIKAQAMSANTTVDFIKAVGFKPVTKNGQIDADLDDSDIIGDKNSEIGDVRYVKFSYKKQNLDGTFAAGHLEIPILSIVPIPMLRIEEMTIDFSVKITESEQNDHGSESASKRNQSTSSKKGVSYSTRNFRFWNRSTFRASLTQQSKNKSQSLSKLNTDTAIDVHVRAVGDELPAGMSKILGILEANIIDHQSSSNESMRAIPEWDSETKYEKNALVTYQGKEYVAIENKDNNINQEPEKRINFWKIPSNLTT